ncbi:Beta-galactosidase [Candidatus Fervidibacteria bacterium JGI MDM2 SSWTFF-3-K9]
MRNWLIGLVLFLMAAATDGSERWRFLGGAWQLAGSQVLGESADGHGFALLASSRYAKAQTVEVTMTPLERRSAVWSAGGLCVFQDGGNFWRLALVEAPDGKTRYAELVAMSNGIWQAQSELRLKIVAEFNPQFSWQWQTTYKLRIVLSPAQIGGEIFSADGRLLWRRVFALDDFPIVRAGWVALNVQGMKASFAEAKQTTHEGEAVAMRTLKQAVVVRDEAMGNTKLAAMLAVELRKLGVQTEMVTLNEIADPQWWQKTKAGIIVLPNAKRFPASACEPLTEFLRQGGKLVAFGAPLLDEPMFRTGQGTRGTGQGWVSVQEIEEKRRQTEPQKFLFERLDENELKRWRHGASHPDVSDRLTLEPAHGLRITHHALRMDFTLKGWAIFVREFPASPFPQGHSLTCFWAKGAPQTKSLLVEWREADGTRWFAHVPLTTEWRLIVLSPKDFVFRADSPTRGKRGFAGDKFNPQNARALVLGMEAPMPQGNHTIWVAGIGTAADPFGDVVIDFAPPVLEALSPAYKLYPLRWDEGRGARDEVKREGEAPAEPKLDSIKIAELPKDAVAPVPRWRGSGFTNGERVMRWRPLIGAIDEKGVERGAIVWLVRYASLPYPHASWLVFGSAEENFWLQNLKVMQAVLKQAVSEWRNGIWLLEAGTDRFTAYPDEQANIGAVIVNDGAEPKRLSVRFAIVAKRDEGRGTGDGKVLYERTETVEVAPQSSATISLPLSTLPLGENLVQVQLRLAGQTVDEINHEFVVVERPKVTEGDKVFVKGGHFVVLVPRPSSPVPEEKRWFAFGINYWPRYIAGKEQSDYWRHWLDPTNYDPELVEQDLLILREIGMNCVSISYTNLRQALPLRDFLRRCHKHGIKVNLFIAGAHPLHFQPDLVRQLIEAADLANQPAMFAYDIAWEPRWGNYNERRRHDAEWRDWLVEQYGSIEAAERDWGFKLPRDEKGNPTVPRDEHLLNDGEWRVMAAAYRRFLDDFISRKYREVCRFIRQLDPNHLIGARTGYGGGPFGAESAFPFDHTAGAKHLDFISPEGWNLGWLGQADEAQFARAVFITAYARWAGKGKPVFWAEFGLTLRHGAFSLDWYSDEGRLKAQAQLYEAMYRLIEISDADGAMGWWFPGGYRVDERSDFGIVNPDGTLRPAAEVAKRWSKILTNLPLVPRPAPLVLIRIDRDENACGAMALWLKHGDEVAKLVQGGKRVVLVTDGTGKISDDVPDVAVGNTPWAPGKPPKFLNGEINDVWVSTDGKEWREVKNGQTVELGKATQLHLRVELGNTGEAAWLPPNECRDKERGIVVRVSVDGKDVVEVPIPKRIEQFTNLVMDGIVVPLPKSDQPVRLTIRLYWRNAPFGERWQFALRVQ